MSDSGMPENHEDQIQLGFRMIQNAFNGKVQALENEVRNLRMSRDEHKAQATTLQKKNSSLEVELVESHQRAQQLAEENKELFNTVKQMQKQVTRLESLKKKVLDSMNDTASDEIQDSDSRLYMRDDYLRGAMPLTMAAAGDGGGYGAKPPVQGGSSSYNPVGSGFGGGASPGMPGMGPSAAGDSYSRSVESAGARQENPVVDGKAFFRQARSHLSYEAFNEFLRNIKQLNNQQQTREETLEHAQRIFGPELNHLYMEFEQLLTKHSSI